jgi:Pectate lyase superfamily protein
MLHEIPRVRNQIGRTINVATLVLCNVALFATLSAPTLSAFGAKDVSNQTFDARQNGLICNGVTDDTMALNTLISKVSSAGGGTIVFPQGTCLLTTIILADNVAFFGQGRGASILKVKDGTADYDAMFGTNRSRFTNVSFLNLTIDQNTRGNPVTTGLESTPRFVIATGGGSSGLVVDNVEFRELANGNTIYSGSASTIIRNSRFVLNCSGSTYYDHSTVYVAGEQSRTEHNIFEGCINVGGSVTAIETHAGGQQVIANTIEGYWIGMNITGVALTTSRDVSITDNTIKDGYYGIQLWSNQYRSHASGYGLDGVVIRHNDIRLTQTAWTKNPVTGAANIGNPSAIWVNAMANLPLANILIQANTIEYDLETNRFTPQNTSGMGIGYWDSTDTNSIRGLEILDNVIRNTNANGIRISANAQDVDISGNTIVNPGSSANSALSVYYRNGIFISSKTPISNVRVNNNIISDNESTSRIARAIYFNAAPGTELSAIGNRFSMSGTDISSLQQFVDSSSNMPSALVQAVVTAPRITVSLLPTHKFALGSSFTDAGWKFIYQASQDSQPPSWIRGPR